MKYEPKNPLSNPKISIVSPSFNTGRFLEETIKSIFGQSYKNFEYIVADGASTDKTIEILKKYPQTEGTEQSERIRWVSEKDNHAWEGLSRAVAMARGEYIMNCCISDGYLDMDWFKKCVEVLDGNKEVSLVWGLYRSVNEDGQPGDVYHRQFHNRMPPQKTEYFYYWLATFDPLPESNFCTRRTVFNDCFPAYTKNEEMKKKIREVDPWNEFVYKFNSRGYLPYFIPTIANFGRLHSGQLSENQRRSNIAKIIYNNSIAKIKRYRTNLLLGRTTHRWRDGAGNILPIKFSRSKFLKEQVFSAYGLRRVLLRVGAAVVRPAARWLLARERVPGPLKTFIKKLKYFYGSRQ